MQEIIDNIFFIFQRLNWLSAIDLFLVTLIFFIALAFLRGTQAMVLVRGIIFLVISISLLTASLDLPAFAWLVDTTLPALLLAVPVIFAPEIRRALERLGRAGTFLSPIRRTEELEDIIEKIVHSISRLSNRRHGALIVLQRVNSMEEFMRTGVFLGADLSPELILQIFYPNTPLHDGAIFIVNNRVEAAGCVLPLSSSGVLRAIPDRQMGLRHRAALGISEVGDSMAIVVSEESGAISIATGGRMIHRLDPERLEGLLRAIYSPSETTAKFEKIIEWFSPAIQAIRSLNKNISEE